MGKELIEKLKSNNLNFEFDNRDISSALHDFYLDNDSESVKELLNSLASFYFKKYDDYRDYTDAFVDMKLKLYQTSIELNKTLNDSKIPAKGIGKIQKFYMDSVDFNKHFKIVGFCNQDMEIDYVQYLRERYISLN